MDRCTRLQRTSALCQHTIRNLAYVQVLSERKTEWSHIHFWICAHNNFLDVGILEWCKLFTDVSGKHHWTRTVSNRAKFEMLVHSAAGMSKSEFSEYCEQLRWYRNRFLAHLDEDLSFRLPKMEPAIASAKTLLQWLLEREDDCAAFPADHYRAEAFHGDMLKDSLKNAASSGSPRAS